MIECVGHKFEKDIGLSYVQTRAMQRHNKLKMY